MQPPTPRADVVEEPEADGDMALDPEDEDVTADLLDVPEQDDEVFPMQFDISTPVFAKRGREGLSGESPGDK